MKVALVGQGPDELFGGYRRHLGVRYGALWGGLPRPIRSAVSSVITALPRNEMLKRGLHSLDIPERMRRYQNVLSLMPGAQIDGFFMMAFCRRIRATKFSDSWEDLAPLMDETDELGGFQFLELRSTLPDELLMYADKLSMAHSLEVRVPYLDKEIVEYVEKLPANLKVRNGSGKWLHRQVCQELLPADDPKKKKKRIRGECCRRLVPRMRGKRWKKCCWIESQIYNYLRPAVGQIFEEHRSGQNDNHKVLFSLIVFEEWLRANEQPVAVLS